MIKLIKIIKEFILVISITLRLQYNSAFIIKSIVFPAFILIHINLPAQQKTTNHPDIQKITVDSVIQTSNYTYVKATTSLKSKIWFALPKKDIQYNKDYYYYNAVEMRNFKSTELKRIFPSVMFINDLINPDDLNADNLIQKKEVINKQVILPPEKGISIAELFKNREKYNNRIIRVSGEVIKYNEGIMKQNWIHLTDFSPDSKNFDFTATTQMETKVGDLIILEGKVTLKKDFGSGYFYEVLMEDSKIIRRTE